MIQIGPKRNDTARMMIAQQLMGSNPRTGHWSDGLVKAGGNLLGSYLMKNEEKKQSDMRGQAMSVLLQGGSPAEIAARLSEMSDNPYAVEAAMQAQQRAYDEERRNGEMVTVYDPEARGMVYQTRGSVQPGMLAAAPQKEDIPKEMQLYQAAQKDPGFAAFLTATNQSGTPKSVQEYQHWISLDEEGRKNFLLLKRASPFLDAGNQYVQPNPADPTQVNATVPKGIGPQRSIENGQVVTLGAVSPQQLGPRAFPPPQSVASPQPVTPGMVTPDSPENGGIAGNMGEQDIFAQQASMTAPGQGMPGQNFPMPGQPQVQELPPTREEREKAAAETEQAAARQVAKERKADVINDTITRALDDLKENPDAVSGFGGALTSWVPMVPAHDFAEKLKTLKGATAFDTLQQMRELSPTGGALGAVSAPELMLLETAYGSLAQSQSAKELTYNIQRYHNIYNDIVHGEGNGPKRYDLGGGVSVPRPKSSGGIDASLMEFMTPEERALFEQ